MAKNTKRTLSCAAIWLSDINRINAFTNSLHNANELYKSSSMLTYSEQLSKILDINRYFTTQQDLTLSAFNSSAIKEAEKVGRVLAEQQKIANSLLSDNSISRYANSYNDIYQSIGEKFNSLIPSTQTIDYEWMKRIRNTIEESNIFFSSISNSDLFTKNINKSFDITISDHLKNMQWSDTFSILASQVATDSFIKITEDDIHDATNIVKNVFDNPHDITGYIDNVDLLLDKLQEIKEELSKTNKNKIVKWLVNHVLGAIVCILLTAVFNYALPQFNTYNVDKRTQIKETKKFIKDNLSLENPRIVIARSYLNVRQLPNKKSKINGRLYQYAIVNVLEIQKKWARISYQDMNNNTLTGWVYKKYLISGQ